MDTVQPSVVIIINLTYSTSALHVYVLIAISTAVHVPLIESHTCISATFILKKRYQYMYL